jgi:acetyl/propionyl-CoA carboxylase alpha subunit
MAAALRETEVLGVRTNLGFLAWLIAQPAFRTGDVDTGYVEREWSPSLVPELPEELRRRAAAALAPAGSPWFADPPGPAPVAADGLVQHEGWQYAVGDDDAEAGGGLLPAGALEAPMPGTVLRVDVAPGQAVEAGQTLVVLEAMKMELSVAAPADGTVRDVHVSAGQLVSRGQPLVAMEDGG